MSSTLLVCIEEERDRKQAEDDDARGQKRKRRDDDEEAGTSQELASILTPGLSGKQSSVNAEDKQFAICMLKMVNGTQCGTVLAKCGAAVCC